MPYWCSNCGGPVPSTDTKVCPYCRVPFGYQSEGTIEQYVIARKKFRQWKWSRFRAKHPDLVKWLVFGSLFMLAAILLWILSFALLSWSHRSAPIIRASLITLVLLVATLVTVWRKSGLLEEIKRYMWTKYAWISGIPGLSPLDPSPELAKDLLRQAQFLEDPFTRWERDYFYNLSHLLQNPFSFANLWQMILLVPRTILYMPNLCVVVLAWLLTVACSLLVFFWTK